MFHSLFPFLGRVGASKERLKWTFDIHSSLGILNLNNGNVIVTLSTHFEQFGTIISFGDKKNTQQGLPWGPGSFSGGLWGPPVPSLRVPGGIWGAWGPELRALEGSDVVRLTLYISVCEQAMCEQAMCMKLASSTLTVVVVSIGSC